jgi:4-hydroxy-3-methylbut-2-enyl diphosphate reductase IspH
VSRDAASLLRHERHYGRGWGVYDSVTCDICTYVWTVVAAIGARGKECPYCGHFDEHHAWRGAVGELPNDGCWLMGI